MADYSIIKSLIQQVVKTNGEQGITGANLQNVLVSMINAVASSNNEDFDRINGNILNLLNYVDTENEDIRNEMQELANRLDTNRFGYNVSVFGLVAGVHTLSTAVKNVLPAERFGGQKITFKTDAGWVTYQNTSLSIDNYEDVNNWVLDSGVNVEGDVTITNNPDYEDLTQNSQNELKFADKEYNADTFSGLGRVYLRKNIVSNKNVLTQAMLADENTIYIIQYDYDLNGATITIPENCVLKFDGGSISNGTLNGDNFRIVAELIKIFDNITFNGNCIKNIYELDWFVKNKNNFCNLDASRKDSTTEVQAAFDSGVINIHISNKFYYYISSTLVLKSWIALVGNNISLTHQRDNIQGEPSFYTDKTITILKVIGDSDNNTKIQKEIILDNVHFRHYGHIGENDYHMDIPVVLLTNGTGVNSQVWGVNLNVFIYVSDRYIQALETYMNGYTGVEILADNNFYFTYIKINGSINGCRRGVYIHKNSNDAWITDVRLDFDSVCVWGGEINATPVRITGSHQPRTQITLQELNDNPYYFIVTSGVSTAMVWDLGKSSGTLPITLYNTKYAFFASLAFQDLITNTELKNSENVVLPPGNNVYRWQREKEWQIIPLGSNFIEKVFNNIKGRLIQDNVSSGLTGGLESLIRGKLESVRAYNSLGQYIDLTEDDIRGFPKLFSVGDGLGYTANIQYYTSNVCILEPSVINQGYNKFECCFVFDKDGIFRTITAHSYLVAIMDYRASDIGLVYLEVEFCNSTDEVLERKRITLLPNDNIYQTRLYLRHFNFNDFDSETAYSYIRLRFCDFRTLGATIPIAKFGIISKASNDNYITTSGGEIGGPLVLRNIKFDLDNSNNGCRYEHNKYINKSIDIKSNYYTKVLNIQNLYQRNVFVLLIRQNGGVAVITLSKSSIICSDTSLNCELEIHTNDYSGRYLLSIKGEVNETIIVYSVYCTSATKFIDVNETHEAGYFDTTLLVDAIKTAGSTSARPTSPTIGQTFFDTTLGKMIVYNGTTWVNLDGTALS